MLRQARKIYDFFTERYARRRHDLYEKGVFARMSGHSGYVLIMVLIVTTLLVAVSGEFIIVAQTDIGYMRKLGNRMKASCLARSGIELSQYVLMADRMGVSGSLYSGKSTSKGVDSYNDIWAFDFPPIPVEEGTVTIKIVDENAKINLSVLANEFVDQTPYYGITQRFFLNLGLPMDFADIIIDWVDIDDSRFPYGAESYDYYQTLETPYSAKNAEMDSIDELMMMRDMTPEIYYGLGGGNYGMEENLTAHNRGNTALPEALFSSESGKENEDETGAAEAPAVAKEQSRKLSDYLRVNGYRDDYLNQYNRININTASYRVLSALTDSMTDDIVTEIINRRLVSPYQSVDDIAELIQDETVRKNILSVKSYIFRIISTAEVGNASVTITAVYNRDKKKLLYWSEN